MAKEGDILLHNLPPMTFIIPAFNEQGAIENTIVRLRDMLNNIGISHEIIVVDDGSDDDTAQIAMSTGVKVIQHPVNSGYGSSLKTGIKNCEHEWCAIVDADGTYPIESFPELLKYVPTFDMIVGARTGRHFWGSRRKMLGRWFQLKLAAYVIGTHVPDVNSGMRIFRKDLALEHFHRISSGYSFTTTLTLAVLLGGNFVKYVPIDYHMRTGKSKVRMIKDTLRMLQVLSRAIMRYNPLKLYLPLCILSLLSGLLFALIALMFSSFSWGISVLITALSVQTALILGAIGFMADTKVD